MSNTRLETIESSLNLCKIFQSNAPPLMIVPIQRAVFRKGDAVVQDFWVGRRNEYKIKDNWPI
jgi:hypothetical protein